MKLKIKRIIILLVLMFSATSKASLFGEENAALYQILEQSIRQYYELKNILQNGQDTLGLLRDVNRGFNDSLYLLKTIKPNIDPGLYKELSRSTEALKKVQEIYGIIANSPDEKVQRNTDQQIAETLAFQNSIYKYTEQIDRIGEEVKFYSHKVSPGGAQKLTAQTLGVMIHVMNESLRAQAMGLKIQATQMSLQNKKDKEFTSKTMEMTESLNVQMKSKEKLFNVPRF